MSIARHHAEWLSLVPVSGPFLSLPVLMEAFNAGLEPHDPDHSRLLRQEYRNWSEAIEKRRGDPAPHHQWIMFVLNGSLGLDDQTLIEGQAIPQTLQVEIPEKHELLRPNFVVVDPATKTSRMLVKTYPRSQELTSYVAGSPWKASPDTRMTELLHGTGVRLGLVTNGEHWMLVDAPKGETTGYISWYANLWLDEPITLRAFRSLLSAERFFGVSEDQTLEALLKKSASNQQEVTEQLGYQVRRAVEVLIHSLDKADQDFGRELLAGVKEGLLYESALTVMMRLVFLFCAEERELIPSKPFPVYDQNYSVSSICKQLRGVARDYGEELLERRSDAWPRLLAAFRAVYGGLSHDDAHIPAYGGSLFDPDRFPFLEGRKEGTNWRSDEASPLPVNNRTVLHLLESLQFLKMRLPGGGSAEPRKVSFRALGIEQIGHVYEGLLDHTAKRATEPYLGLAGTRDKEPEIPLAELERLVAKGENDLVKFLKEATGRSESALKKGLKSEIEDGLARLFRTACQGDEALWGRVKPFAGLVRLDNFSYPVVIPKGSVFVTEGTDRRSSGTHYTPKELTEPIVKHTLEPLVYVGPAEGKPKAEWRLKSAKELLDLKICDMACGSGAFLVQAARYMAERLLEAWDEVKKANPTTPGITPEGKPSAGLIADELIPNDPDERATYAMRIIAQRCLYGVDKNPLAAEMAKLSLWLLTVAKDKPFEFLDHAIRCGDSLVGLHSLDQLRHFSLKPDADDAVLFRGPLDRAVDEAIDLRLRLEGMPANSIEDVERQEALLRKADEKIARLRCAADLLVAAEFWGESEKDKLEQVRHAAVVSGHYIEMGSTEEFEAKAAKERRRQAIFHWPLEFPEVVVNRGGFNAVIGNPPFMGGNKISGELGLHYRGFVVSQLAADVPGAADLSAFFVLRGYSLLSTQGTCGFLTTNTISQGDTRQVGLESCLKNGANIFRAVSSRKWPGIATVEVSHLWLIKGAWQGGHVLDEQEASSIDAYLRSTGTTHWTPERLAENAGIAFKGVVLLGMGFVIDETEVEEFIKARPENRDVLRRYMNGAELNSLFNQEARRWVISFNGWPLDKNSAPKGYQGPVASDYPECLKIIENRVKPERDNSKRETRREKWWQYGERSPALYDAIRGLDRVLAIALTSKTLSPEFVSSEIIHDQSLVVFARSDIGFFGIINSSIHYWWALTNGSSMRTDARYLITDCFETFPFPTSVSSIPPEIISKAGIYWHYRKSVMTGRSEGLTKTYNRYHNPDEMSADIQKLRRLHVEMDIAVASAYGWWDLDLGFAFHKTKQGIRFTISEPARHEVLQRLLKLNHERYAEEEKESLHNKKGATKKLSPKRQSTPKTGKDSPALFDVDDDA